VDGTEDPADRSDRQQRALPGPENGGAAAVAEMRIGYRFDARPAAGVVPAPTMRAALGTERCPFLEATGLTDLDKSSTLFVKDMGLA